MPRPLSHVAVFCGSAAGNRPEYQETARALGRELAERGQTLVYGGGSIGLMGLLADAALAAGGSVIGVMPEAIVNMEVAHRGLTELRVTQTMHERKALMADLSEAFVAMPGGFGTLDELFEIITWAQLGIHHKPIGLLDVAGFFAPLVQLVEHSVRAGFVRPEHQGLLVTAGEPGQLLDQLATHEPPRTPKLAQPARA